MLKRSKSTLRQIAKEAGVSIDTVSRVLNGRNKELWPGTMQRAATIRAIAQKLKYRPNSSARAIRTGRSNAMALLQSSVAQNSYLPWPLLNGIYDAMERHDLHLMLSRMPDEKLVNPAIIPEILRYTMSDGLLVNYHSRMPAQLVELIGQYQIPAIFINVKADADCVYSDDHLAGKIACQELIKRGHRQISYIDYHNNHSDPETHYSAFDRYRGYVDAMREAGLVAELRGGQFMTPEQRIAECTRLLKLEERPTAILAYSEDSASFLTYAASMLGVRMPQDLSIATFSNQPAIVCGIKLTTLVSPWQQIGELSVELLKSKIKDPAVALASKAVPFVLYEGTSVVHPVLV